MGGRTWASPLYILPTVTLEAKIIAVEPDESNVEVMRQNTLAYPKYLRDSSRDLESTDTAKDRKPGG